MYGSELSTKFYYNKTTVFFNKLNQVFVPIHIHHSFPLVLPFVFRHFYIPGHWTSMYFCSLLLYRHTVIMNSAAMQFESMMTVLTSSHLITLRSLASPDTTWKSVAPLPSCFTDCSSRRFAFAVFPNCFNEVDYWRWVHSPGGATWKSCPQQ